MPAGSRAAPAPATGWLRPASPPGRRPRRGRNGRSGARARQGPAAPAGAAEPRCSARSLLGAVALERAHLDPAERLRHLGGDLDGTIVAVNVHDAEAHEELLGLGVGS